VTPLLARALIGTAVRDEQGHRLGRVQDVGFAGGELRLVRTEHGVFQAYARAGDRLIAGPPAMEDASWLGRAPGLEGDRGRAIHDLVLDSGLHAPFYVVSRGLWHDLVHGRELVPSSRVGCQEASHDLP